MPRPTSASRLRNRKQENPMGKTGQPELSDFRAGIEAASGFLQLDRPRAGLVEKSRSSGYDVFPRITPLQAGIPSGELPVRPRSGRDRPLSSSIISHTRA